MAATGRVIMDDLVVGAGAARVALLNPIDSTVVGEEFATLDDGSYRVWFPHALATAGCNWLLRARHANGVTEIRPLLGTSTACVETIYHDFVLDSTP